MLSASPFLPPENLPHAAPDAALDRQVAERVMGWKVVGGEEGFRVEGHDVPLPPSADEATAHRAFDRWLAEHFRPASRIEDAWQVHRRMDRTPNDVLSAYLAELDRILFARWRQRTGARVARSEDMPGYIMELDAESICRAALAAAGPGGLPPPGLSPG